MFCSCPKSLPHEVVLVCLATQHIEAVGSERKAARPRGKRGQRVAQIGGDPELSHRVTESGSAQAADPEAAACGDFSVSGGTVNERLRLRDQVGFGPTRNPAYHVSPPRLHGSDIEPPEPAQVAKQLEVAWTRDPDFGPSCG